MEARRARQSLPGPLLERLATAQQGVFPAVEILRHIPETSPQPYAWNTPLFSHSLAEWRAANALLSPFWVHPFAVAQDYDQELIDAYLRVKVTGPDKDKVLEFLHVRNSSIIYLKMPAGLPYPFSLQELAGLEAIANRYGIHAQFRDYFCGG